MCVRFLRDAAGSWKLRLQMHEIALRRLGAEPAKAGFVLLLVRFQSPAEFLPVFFVCLWFK